jgi:predicted nucleic acid-binding protein
MIYLDSCVPIYAAINPGSRGRWSRSLLTSIEKGDESAVTSTLTLDEFTYKVREVEGAEASVEAGRILLDLPNLRFAPVDYEVLWRSLELVEKFGLYPRDSIHTATAQLQNINTIISEDKDFDTVPKIKRRWMK